VEVINTGIVALGSSELVPLYAEEWIEFGPQLVVVNMSNNDNQPEVFAQNLYRLIDLNRARGIRTLFVLEANSPEEVDDHLPVSHAVMRRVAQERSVPVLDMHAHLAARRDDGFLWWDQVHLTSYGQQLVGDRLRDAIVPMLRSEPETRAP
jgi:lysophospholipase L1-like esterase